MRTIPCEFHGVVEIIMRVEHFFGICIKTFDLQFDLQLFLQATTVIGGNKSRDLF